MRQVNRANILRQLQTELPELTPITEPAGAVLGKFLISSISLVAISFGLYRYAAGPELNPIVMAVLAGVTLIVAYFMGYLVRAGSQSVGAGIALSGYEDYNNVEYFGRPDWQVENEEEAALDRMAFGVGIIVLEFFFGSIYGALFYLRHHKERQDSSRALISTCWIAHILSKGASTQTTLFNRPDVKEMAPDKLRSTLRFLLDKGILSSNNDRFSIASDKRTLFA